LDEAETNATTHVYMAGDIYKNIRSERATHRRRRFLWPRAQVNGGVKDGGELLLRPCKPATAVES
jgi:hypothetical protein